MSTDINNNQNQNQNQNINPEPEDEITKQIRQELDEELSYTRESSKASSERVKYLAKKNEYNVMMGDGKSRTLRRIPLSAKKNKELEDLRSAFMTYKDTTQENPVTINGIVFTSRSDILFEAYKKCALYSLGLTEDEYNDAVWEDDDEYMKKDIWGTRSIIEGILLRSVHGIAHFSQP